MIALDHIAGDQELVRKTVTDYLRRVIYHRLKDVNELYRIVFGTGCVDLLPLDKQKKLPEAIQYRHLCVHRNGHDNDNKPLDVFTKAYVAEITELMTDFVQAIEKKVRELDVTDDDIVL